MINYKTRTDKYGNELVDFEVLKGDTFTISLSLSTDKTQISPDKVVKVLYRQSLDDYQQKYENEFTYNAESERYIMTIPSEATATFTSDESYIYEIEVTVVGGDVITPTQAKIKYKEQIVEE